jgi:propanol-preferring alcohol dehydrogenase
MRAAVFYGVERPIKVEEVGAPQISSGEVLVKVSSCGICGGDMQRVLGTFKVVTPVILGHEPAGVVSKVGDGVEGFEEGERVGISPIPTCGTCFYCSRGMDNLCVNITKAMGQSVAYVRDQSLYGQGAYAEYAVVKPRQLFKLPSGVRVEAGSVISASAGTVYHAIKKAAIRVGETVAIFGFGDLGSQAVQFLNLMGVRVIVVDLLDEKLRMAKELGADEGINAGEEDPVKKIRELTEGRGADAAFEVIGLRKTMEQAIECVRKGGRIVDIGSVMEPVTLKMAPSPQKMEGFSLSKEVTLMTVTHFAQSDLSELLGIASSGKLNFELGTAKLPLDEINEAFDAKKHGNNLRVLVVP